MTTDEIQRQVLDALKQGKIKPDKVIMGDLVEGDVIIINGKEN